MARSDFDIKALLSQMTLDEKIGQLIQLNASFMAKTEADITGPQQKWGMSEEMLKCTGSVLNFDGFASVKEIQDKHMESDRRSPGRLLLFCGIFLNFFGNNTCKFSFFHI